jgi:hypothetical protein
MKALRFLAIISLFAGGLMLSARAESPAATKKSLQMQVNPPLVVDLLDRNEVADELFSRVGDGIKAVHRGVEIKEVKGDESTKGEPVLILSLINWRQTRMGDIECRFSAEYRSADGKQSLGIFEGTTSSITRSRAFAGDDFGRAAEEAGRRLGEALKKKKLI